MKTLITKLLLLSLIPSLILLFGACSSDDGETGECIHEYGNWTVTATPTCENDGIRTKSCTKCQLPIHEPITALGHSYEIVEILTDATCDQEGSAKFVCNNDSMHTKTDSIPSLGHSFSDWSIAAAATCENDGKEKRICANDSSHIEERALTKLQHVFSEYSLLSPATCSSNEKLVATCTNSGCDYKDVIEKEGTITEHVLSEYTSHTKATCEENTTLIAHCLNSDCTFTDVKELPNTSTGHRFENYTTEIPDDCSIDHLSVSTCATPGCSATDKKVLLNTALGHEYEDGLCNNCKIPLPVKEEWIISASISAKLYYLKANSYALSVDGNGTIPDYDSNGAPWSNYSSQIKVLELSDEITSIGSNAFYNFSEITKIVIGEAISSIGRSAFSNCFALTQIDFNSKKMEDINYIIFENVGIDSPGIVFNVGAGVERIPNYLFFSSSENSPNVTNITFADSQATLSIGAHAFSGLKNLTSVSFSNAVSIIDNYAFYGCNSLDSISLIDASVSTIGDYAFYGCTKISEFISSDALTYIGTYAFSGCSALTRAHFGNNISMIAEFAFYKCTSLSEVNFGENLVELGESTFSGCSSLSDVSLPTSLAKFTLSTFEGCNVITTVNGITYIDNWVIGCERFAINVLSLKDDVVGFFENAFSNCERLETILIPKTVKYIMKNALNNSPNLKTVYFKSDENDWATVTINEHNASLSNAKVLFYSEIDPKESDTHWYYSDDKIFVWNNWSNFSSPVIPLFSYDNNIVIKK